MLHYREAGQGLPVVLLHGYPLDSSIWDEQRERLSDQFRIITPDLRGHGQSPLPAGPYTMALLAHDVFALLDSLAIKQAVIMGHSMGGYAALAGWRVAPERYLALGLIASQAGADTEEGRQGRYKTAEKVAAEGSKVVAQAMPPKLFAPGQAMDTPIVERTRQLIMKTRPEAIIAALQGMAARADTGPLLAGIDVPALVLAGADDQIIAPEKARALAAALPRATLAIIDKSGHMPMLEQPAATTAALRAFLSKLSSAAR